MTSVKSLLMWKQLSLISLLVGVALAGQPYAELTALKTKDSSASSYEHGQFTKCHGGMYFVISSVSSSGDDATNGLYRLDDDNTRNHSIQLTSSLGKVRGLTCHQKFLYYYKRTADDGMDSTSWGLYRFNLASASLDNAEEYLHNASDFKHEPLVNYEGDLFMAARGPKLYKLTLTTDEPKIGLAWQGLRIDDKVYPESMIVHKNERDSDLYFVAPGDGNDADHASLWKFNIQNDQATMLKDLVLRTGDSEATIANMISYKGQQDYAAQLYFSLGGFETNDGHHRLAKWEDDGSLPIVKLVTGYDPSHLTVYKGDLYMVLRKPKDVSKYGVWRWNGRFVKQVFSLPNEGKISHMTVWDDMLVVSGHSGPLVVFNGSNAAIVEASNKLTDVSDMIAYEEGLILAATEDPVDQGNGLWSLSKGVWQLEGGSNPKDDKDSGSNHKPSTQDIKPDEDSDTNDKDASSGSLQPAWTKEVSSSGGGGGGIKAIIVLSVVAFMGGLCWWAYKTNQNISRRDFSDTGSKGTLSGDESDGMEGGFMA